MTTIVQAVAADELADAQHLLQVLDAWRRERRGEDYMPSEHGIGDDVLAAEFQEPLQAYTPPRGRLLVAYEAAQPSGAAALRDLGDGICEVAWMFVPPPFQRQRVGQALAERLLLEAKAAGYKRMRFHISLHEDEALALCEHLGFQPSNSHPAPLGTVSEPYVFYEQDLRPMG